MNEPIHILSLGAGVQSSTLALMAAAGEVTPMPKAAVFADTHAEPASVYRWLDWLEGQIPFPVFRVSNGALAETSTQVRVGRKSGETYLSHAVPAYTLAPDGSKGTLFRQCTDKHKIVPLRKAIDELRGESDAVVWIGISTDEMIRMKPSRFAGITHIWPLIDKGASRKHCIEWMKARGFPTPPRSSCSFCPYHSDREWRRIRDTEPEAFADAVEYERRLQRAIKDVPRMHATPYLHNSRVPLDKVDFSTDVERGQGVLFGGEFGEECEGMCGV